MRVALKIFMRDLGRILRNPVAIIVTLGVAVIPCLYAWLNVVANWDPYKNTSDIPIAIVNEDVAAEAGDQGTINAGDQIVDELKQNDQLGWTFVDRDSALDGVNDGRYYAAIVIPSDFTESLADVLGGNTNKANIEYYVNEKVNPIAPKVTDTGSSTLEEQISNRFASVVGGVIVDKLQGFASRTMKSAEQSSEGIVGDVSQVQASLGELDTTLQGLSGTIDSTQQAISGSKGTIAALKSASESAADGLSQASDDLSEARSSAQGLSAQLMKSLGTDASTLSDISSRTSGDIGVFSGKIGAATGNLDSAANTLDGIAKQGRQVTASLTSVRDWVKTLPDTHIKHDLLGKIDALVSKSSERNKEFEGQIDELRHTSDSIKEGNKAIENLSSSINAAVQDGSSQISDLTSSYTTDTAPQVSAALDSFADVSGQITGTLAQVSPLLDQLKDTLDQLSDTLVQANGAIALTRDTLKDTGDNLNKLQSDLGAIQTTEAWRALQSVIDVNREDVANFMEAPASIDDVAIYPVANYGSGIAPFFTSVALWVGGIALIVIYKMEIDPEGVPAFSPWQGYVARLLLLVLIGQLQAISCCAGNLIIGIQCQSPVAYFAAAMVASFVFVNIIFALTVAFKHIGRALAFLLVVLQVPGSSGMYPIEMMPGFFQAICPWLPFTYSNNAMREAIGGFYGNHYAFNLTVLLLFVLPSLTVGMLLRRHLLNINALFDRELRETDMVVSEYDDMNEAHFKLSTIIKIAMDSESYGDVFLERMAAFELAYPTLIRRGIAAVFVVPLALLALLCLLPYKLPILELWIISLIVICTYLIVIEYLHGRIAEKSALTQMSKDELYGILDSSLKHELFAFAPVERIKLRRTATNEEASAEADVDTGAGEATEGMEIGAGEDGE